MDEKRRIVRAAGAMSAATSISRVLGYIRDMVFAFFFGATGLSDAFFTAFRIPNLLRELFAEGSMSAALIPVLTEYDEKKGRAEARKLVRAVMGFILIVVGGITVSGIIFSPAIVSVIAPGFLGSPEKFALTVRLTRMMFPFLFFISLAALLMGALNARRVFFVPALAPAMLNLTIIGTVFALYWQGVNPIVAVALGVTLGGMVQFGAQAPSFLRGGYSLRPLIDFGHPGLRRIFKLVLPVTFGMAVAQINTAVSNILASYLPGGSITYLFYSMHLIQLPIGVFGVAMGTAVLPSLSSHAVRGDMESLREDFSFALRLLFFITVPAMAGLIALREPIISTLFQRGRFDYQATVGTAKALVYYSLGIWAVVGVRVTAATFYSMQDTRTPVKAAALSLFVNAALSLALMGPMKHAGLALANASASVVNFTLLFYLLRRRLGKVGARATAGAFLRAAFSAAAMGLAGWAILASGKWSGLWMRQGAGLAKAASLAGTITLCALIYIILSRITGSRELGYIWNLLRKRRKGKDCQP